MLFIMKYYNVKQMLNDIRNVKKYSVIYFISRCKFVYSCFLFLLCFMVFNATFHNISVISWRSVL